MDFWLNAILIEHHSFEKWNFYPKLFFFENPDMAKKTRDETDSVVEPMPSNSSEPLTIDCKVSGNTKTDISMEINDLPAGLAQSLLIRMEKSSVA